MAMGMDARTSMLPGSFTTVSFVGAETEPRFYKVGGRPGIAKKAVSPRPKKIVKPVRSKEKVGVSRAQRNLKSLDTKKIRASRAIHNSLSNKEKLNVRQRLNQLRNEVITNKNRLTHTFDRAAANLRPFAGGRIRKYTTTKTETFYRVYSGDKASGGFLTKTPPSSSAEARRLLNLDSSNKATKIQKVTVPPGVRLERSRVTGNGVDRPGGGVQYRILPGQEAKGIIFHKGKSLT